MRDTDQGVVLRAEGVDTSQKKAATLDIIRFCHSPIHNLIFLAFHQIRKQRSHLLEISIFSISIYVKSRLKKIGCIDFSLSSRIQG